MDKVRPDEDDEVWSQTWEETARREDAISFSSDEQALTGSRLSRRKSGILVIQYPDATSKEGQYL